MKNFRFVGGDELENLDEYIKNYYLTHPDIKIYIGTDSAQHGKVTKYATTICFLNPGKGVHVIYRKTNIKRERDLFARLWNEVEYSREVADHVHNVLSESYKHPKNEKIPTIHLDFNKSPKYKSNMVHDASIGYLKGLGYKVESKSDSWASTIMADLLVKK